MIPVAIKPMVAAKRQMPPAGIRVYGVPNFGVKTFDDTRCRFAFLNEFADVVVSGTERIKKPDPAIFRLCVAQKLVAPRPKRVGTEPNIATKRT